MVVTTWRGGEASLASFSASVRPHAVCHLAAHPTPPAAPPTTTPRASRPLLLFPYNVHASGRRFHRREAVWFCCPICPPPPHRAPLPSPSSAPRIVCSLEQTEPKRAAHQTRPRSPAPGPLGPPNPRRFHPMSTHNPMACRPASNEAPMPPHLTFQKPKAFSRSDPPPNWDPPHMLTYLPMPQDGA